MLFQSRLGGGCASRNLQALAVAILLALASAILPGAQVQAQTTAPAGNYVVIQDKAKQVPKLSMTVGQIIGQDLLYGTRRLATASQVLADPAGNPVAIVARFGGFFGYFEHQVALPLENINPGKGYLDATISPEALEKLPAWK